MSENKPEKPATNPQSKKTDEPKKESRRSSPFLEFITWFVIGMVVVTLLKGLL